MKKIILVVLLLAFQQSFAQTGWFWQNPTPQGANITDVKFISTSVVIATTRGTSIMKSTDKGLNWSVKNIVPIDIGHLSTLDYISVINTNTIFVMQSLLNFSEGVYKNKILKSFDAGETWTKTDMPYFGYENKFNLKFINNNTGFACGTDISHTEVYRTTNSGINWERFYINGNDSLTSLFFLNANTGWAGSKNSKQFYKTTDGEINWSTHSLQISSMGEMERWLHSFFLNENTGWFQAWGYAYKTTNGGNNWAQAPFSFSNNLLFINELTGFRLSSKTTNGGVNWISQIDDQDYNTFALSDNNLNGVLAGEYGKLQATSNAGSSWVNLLKTITPIFGFPDNYEQISFVDANTGWFITWSNGLYKTTNSGAIWNRQLTGNFPSNLNFINQNTGLAGSHSNISRTTNGGNNWISVYSGDNCNSLAYFKNDTAIAQLDNFGNTQQLIRSTNGGANWVNIGGQLPFYEDNVHFINSQLAFCSLGPSLHKSTNGGLSWINLHNFFGTALYNLHFLNENTGFVNLDSGIYKTTDGGTTFSCKIYLQGGSISTYQFVNERTGWAAGGRGGIGILLKTSDEGETWQQGNNADCMTLNSICFINENTGWVCGDESVILKTTTGGSVSVQQISATVPDKFYLSQNYPNPFNPNTVISFQLPVAGFVKLKVFDLLGREIANLVNENLSVGSYKYDFNASALPSGIYFYKLEAENFSETRKMVLVK